MTTIRIPTRVDSPDQVQRLSRYALNAPAQENYRVVNADYTVRDEDDILLVTAAATVTLPAPSTVHGRKFTVVRVGAGAVTVVSAEGETISGSASRPLGTQWDSFVMLACSTDNGLTYSYVIV